MGMTVGETLSPRCLEKTFFLLFVEGHDTNAVLWLQATVWDCVGL